MFGAKIRVPGRLAALVFIGIASVKRKRRIGQDAVKSAQFPALDVLEFAQGVFAVQIGGADAVQQHVHLGDGPQTVPLASARKGWFCGLHSPVRQWTPWPR